jgi:hypothetical protein
MKNILLIIFIVLLSLKESKASRLCFADNYVYSSRSVDILTDPTLWRYCSLSERKQMSNSLMIKLKEELHLSYDSDIDVNNIPSKWQKIINNISNPPAIESPLVHISSEYIDIGMNTTVQVDGIGTVVMQEGAQNRFFILTAGHLAKGKNLQVVSEHKEKIKIIGIKLDDESDLALVEIENINFSIYPLAIYKNGFLSSIMTRSTTSLPSEKLWNYSNIDSNQTLVGVPLEGLQAFINIGEGSFAPIAPWVNIKINSDLYKEQIEKTFFKRDNDLVKTNPKMSFAKGLSGTPLVMPYQTSYGPLNIISGVLTLSAFTSGGASSSFAATKSIKGLFEAKYSPISSQWLFYHGYFLKVTGLKFELYIDYGPVGNGMIVERSITSIMDKKLLTIRDELDLLPLLQ